MNLAEKNRKFLEKLRNLPENKKKIILWTIVAIAALTMGFFWVLEIKNSLSVADKEMQKIKIPQIITPDIQNPILQSITGQPTDLKTYTSDKYNFEFKYLPDLTVEISPIQDLDIGLSTLAFKQNTTYPIWFYIAKTDDTNIKDKIFANSIDVTNLNRSESIINGLVWKKIETESMPTGGIGTASSSSIYYTQAGDNYYMFECLYCDVNILGQQASQTKSIFDQIVSTFKFINK